MKETIIHKGFINLVKKDKWEIVRTKGACAVAFVDKDSNVWLVKQFRPAINKTILELPAETYDKSKDLKPIDYAHNALREELGIIIDQDAIKHIISLYVSPGYTDEKIDLFIANGIFYSYKQVKQKLDKDEKIEIVKLSLSTGNFNNIQDLKTNYLIYVMCNI